jgi:chemotaxis protein CheC
MDATNYQIDALKELINISVGRAAGTLNQMIDSHVHLQVPEVRILSPAEMQEHTVAEFDREKLAAVQLTFKGSFSGTASLVFPPDSAAKLVDVLTGEEPGAIDLDAIRIGALTEVGNIILNGVMGSISNVLEQHLKYTIPTYVEDRIEHLLALDDIASTVGIVLARTRFTVAQLSIEGDILLLFEVGSLEMLLVAIGAQDLEV